MILKLNLEQRAALGIVFHKKSNLLLLGEAYTGKQTIEKAIIKYSIDNKVSEEEILVLGPTMTSVQALTGRTVHSWMDIGELCETNCKEWMKKILFQNSILEQKQPIKSNDPKFSRFSQRQFLFEDSVLKRARKVKILILEDIQQWSSCMFEYVETIFRMAHDNCKQSFGGKVTVIAQGDFYKLIHIGGSPIYNSHLFKCAFKNKALITSQIFGSSDSKFDEIRQRIRYSCHSDEDIQYIQKKAKKFTKNEEDNVLTLYSTKKEVKDHNNDMVAKHLSSNCLSTPRRWKYKCLINDFELEHLTDKYKEDNCSELQFRKHKQQKEWRKKQRALENKKLNSFNIASDKDMEYIKPSYTILDHLHVKFEHEFRSPEKWFIGMRVRLTKSYQSIPNGELGTVVHWFDVNSDTVKNSFDNSIDENFSSSLPQKYPVIIVQFDKGMEIQVCPHWELLNDESFRFIRLLRYPLFVSYAETFHFASGKKFKSIHPVFENIFCPGQFYTGISCVRSVDDIYLSDNLTNSKIIKAPEEIDQFYLKLESYPKEYLEEQASLIQEYLDIE
jgi:hypothetical protein